MQQSIRTRVLVIRTGAPTDSRTLGYLVLLGSALVVGGIAVWEVRQRVIVSKARDLFLRLNPVGYVFLGCNPTAIRERLIDNKD